MRKRGMWMVGLLWAGTEASMAQDQISQVQADAYRGVLANEPRQVLRFSAARALIGLEPAPVLLAEFLPVLIQSASAGNRGTWDTDSSLADNHDIAMEALTALVEYGDRRLIPPLLAELDTAHPVVPSVMRLLARFDPDPDDWAATLLDLTRSPGDDIRPVAWELLGDAGQLEQVAVWWPTAIAALDDPATRKFALDAIDGAAGQRVDGLEKVAAVMLDPGNELDVRKHACRILGYASSENNSRGDAAMQAAAARIAQPAYARLLQREPDGDLVRDASQAIKMLRQDKHQTAGLLVEAIERNPDPAAQARLLGALSLMQSEAKPFLDRIRPLTAASDERVRMAAADVIETATRWD